MDASHPKPFNLRVFISSTFSDLQEYRQASFNAIQSLGAHGDDMIYWSADERSGANLSVDRVRQCDVVILLLAHRYGYVPEGSAQGITEMEYGAAREAGIPVLAFFLDESEPWPPDRIEWDRVEQLRAFKQRVEAEVTRKLFRSTDELARLVTQALALFMERHRQRLEASRRFEGTCLRVESSIALKAQSDTVVHIGTAEDGLPLLLKVKRSRDLSRHLDALAHEIAGPNNPPPEALLSAFRQSLEAHARDGWAQERVVPVRWPDGSFRKLYVSGSNLSQLFRSSLAMLLASANVQRDSDMAIPEAHSVIRTVAGPPALGKAPVLQSEGGQNRFLGVDPCSGEAYSVGREGNQWVQWRTFLFEALEPAFPGATFRIARHAGSSPHLSQLPQTLFDLAIQRGDAEGRLDVEIWVCVQRQQIGILLAEIAQRVGLMHGQGAVHGDLKPNNILVGAEGPVLIDGFGLAEGAISPGWTPTWSAPEQILGEPIGAAADLYPIGRMISDLLGGCLVGEVRKFKSRPLGRGTSEFDIFYNPAVHVEPDSAVAKPKGLAAWQSLARTCLRFASTDRPSSAAELEARLRALVEEHPLHGEVRIPIAGELRVAMLLDGSQTVARLVSDGVAAFPPATPFQGAIPAPNPVAPATNMLDSPYRPV